MQRRKKKNAIIKAVRRTNGGEVGDHTGIPGDRVRTVRYTVRTSDKRTKREVREASQFHQLR